MTERKSVPAVSKPRRFECAVRRSAPRGSNFALRWLKCYRASKQPPSGRVSRFGLERRKSSASIGRKRLSAEPRTHSNGASLTERATLSPLSTHRTHSGIALTDRSPPCHPDVPIA